MYNVALGKTLYGRTMQLLLKMLTVLKTVSRASSASGLNFTSPHVELHTPPGKQLEFQIYILEHTYTYIRMCTYTYTHTLTYVYIHLRLVYNMTLVECSVTSVKQRRNAGIDYSSVNTAHLTQRSSLALYYKPAFTHIHLHVHMCTYTYTHTLTYVYVHLLRGCNTVSVRKRLFCN